MSLYKPPTTETDPKKQNMAIQGIGNAVEKAQSDISTNATGIAALQTPDYGLVNNDGSLGVSLSKITASLSADVSLNNVSNYFDGPSIAQGATGTWWVSGTVTLQDTAAGGRFSVKLWDGTTVIASATLNNDAATALGTVSLSGYIVSPASNIKISCLSSATTGKIKFNVSGNSKDSTISAVRIA